MEEEWGEPVPLEGPPAACMEEEVDQDLSGQCEIREPIPKEDTPIEVASIEDTPIEVVSIEDTPIEVVSIEDTTVEIAPIEDTPIEQVSIEETPTEPMPCEVKQCEDIPRTATPPEATPLKASPPDDIRATAVPADVGEREEVVTPSKVTNGCHVAPNTSRVTLSLAKQAPVTVNRTARPFGATATTTVRSPVDFPPPPSCVTPPLPRIYSPPPSAFSPPPPMTYSTPSNPNHNLPAYSKATPPAYSNPSPVAYSSAAAQVYSDPNPPAYSSRSPQVFTNPPPPPPPYCSPPPLSRVISPSPCLPQYGHPSAPRPTYIPDLLVDRRQAASPIKTGILEDGKTRRAARKSMFTFQEKPKVAPNPELLSLVQGVDQRKRGPSLPEPPPEEELELLALGAEASNFLPKGGEVGGAGLEEAAMPEWSSCLKSSGAPVRQEPKVEQGLANASGKGAELFARRQTRMERFESAGGAYGRAPSPTASLPPSWTFPSHMPGRVKAMVDISNASVTSSAQAPPARTAKPRPGAAMAPPPPRPESPVLENGCTKLEMEISRHKPYQLNSSLFILNPTRDPMSSLPKAAPPPKPVLNRAHGRHTSLPAHNPPPLSPHYTSPAPFRPFSPQAPLSPVNGAGFSDLRSNCTPPPPWPGTSHIASSVFARSPERPPAPRNVVQAPRPTFSAKKAGLEPQTRRESLPTPTTPTRTTPVPMATPTASQQLRRFSSPEALAGGLKFRPASPVPPPSSASRSLHPSSFSSPLSPSQETRCQSPLAGPEAKANRRLLAQNIINAAKRKNSPSPGGQNGRAGCLSPFQPRPLGGHSPTLASPPPTPTRSARSPVRLYATRSLTDSDASLESEDSGLRSPGLRSYNTCPRGWGGSLRIKRGTIHADL